MSGRSYLAFDLGAESGRAMLGTLDGGRLVLEEKHRFANPIGRMNGHLHWNVLGQWEQLKAGLAAASRDPRGRPIELAGIGVDTWGIDFGLLARGGELLGNPYHYRDTRTQGMMELAIERVGRDRIFQSTGVQFLVINTLYQLLAMRQSGSRLLDAAQTLLFMPDLFNFLFTGERVSEFSIATTSQMYDPRKGAWAADLLEELDLPAKILPRVVPSATVLGPLREDVAAECGLPVRVPVIAPGCHDTASAVAAVPAEGQDWCYISSGTWSLLGAEVAEPVISDTVARHNFTNEGGVAGRIRLLKNISGLWLVQECRRHWQGQGQAHSYAELTAMAERAAPFTALIDPDDADLQSPGDMPGKIAAYCQRTAQSPPAEKGQFVRACLESLALTYRRTLEQLEEILGRRIDVIHIVGGGSRNALLNQMTASACNRPVLAGPVEATAIGNILTQAMATGQVGGLDDLRRIVRASFEVTRCEPRDATAWDGTYRRYQDIIGR